MLHPLHSTSRREAIVVVDLGFGDAGKGTVTDYLARERGVHTVVRFNGGAQAAHNVVTADGRHHTFAQFGAGTFVPGVRTHLSRFTVVHPTALLVEARRLAEVGVGDALERLTVHRAARVITPFQQAACRLRELARGGQRHGTCGVGVGEVMRDALEDGAAVVLAGDLDDPPRLRRKLVALQARKRAELADVLRVLAGDPAAERERRVLESGDIVDAWLDAVVPLQARGATVDDAALGAALRSPGSVVFEGAQGVLLDEWHGFHPYTTWSTCTFDNAVALLREHGWDAPVTRLGVVRAYATRHGPGPFPTEEPALAECLPEPHNGTAGWQGAFRVGWLDATLLRYALAACRGADALAVTHLDRLPGIAAWKIGVGYSASPRAADARFFELAASDPARATGVRPGPARDLEYQEALGRALAAMTPEYEAVACGPDGEDYLRWIETALGVPVTLTSHGPAAGDKRARRAAR